MNPEVRVEITNTTHYTAAQKNTRQLLAINDNELRARLNS